MNSDSLTSIPQASQDAANANPTVGGQLSALRGGGQAPAIGQGSSDPTLGAPPVSQTQDASQISSQLSGGSTGVVFPQAPGAPTNGVSANTSVANPIPSAADIVNQGAQTTPAEATNQTLLQKVAALIGQKQGQTQLTNTAETAAGIPALADTRQSLIDQLQGLSDQSTKLQIDAGAGGSIQNQEQQDVLGRGVTAAGLAPLTAGDLRKNQIQQASIAAQSLTIKALFLGADRKYTEAKDAADKAATAQYEDQQNQIDYQNALIAANLPQMNKEEKAQAALVQQNLADRQSQLDQAKADKQTIIAAATATLAAYPNDSAAHYAAQQALTESNQQQPDLSKALGLLSKYPSLATQQAQATLASTRADTAYKNAQISGLATSANDPTAAPTDPNSQSILSQTGLSIAAFNYLTQGTSALSRMTSAARQQVMAEAQNFLNKNGLDYSTFQSQYTAQNKVVQDNVARAAQTKVFAGEVSGSVDSLISAIQANKDDQKNGALISSITGGQGGGMSSLKAANVLSLMQGNAVNNAFAQTYSTQLAFVANDLAGYLAAARGASQPELTDQKDAANIIAKGMNTGSLTAFKNAIDSNEAKVNGVVNGAVTSAQKSVWDQFGVGDKYNPTASTAASNTTTKSGKPFDVAGAKKAGYSDADIQAYLASH